MIPPEWLEQAARRLQGQIEKKPLTYAPELMLCLKWENRQRTGSFQIHDGLNNILALESWEHKDLLVPGVGNEGGAQ